MSKLKFSVSAAMMLVIFGLFSIVAFAAAPDAPTGLTSKPIAVNKMEINWNPVAGADYYNVYVNGNPAVKADTAKYDTDVLPTGDNKIEVTAVTGVEESPKASITFKIVSHGTVKNDGTVGTHKTHGDYQNNTNACANCHSTHNGKDAGLLKFQSSEYDMCLSCHDGTLGFYNVKVASNAGVMNSSHESASMHNVSSGIAIESAPGAYAIKGKANSSKPADSSEKILKCSSCHSPHGSVNDRLLKENIFTIKSGYDSIKIPWSKTVPVGTKAITLDLNKDPAYDDFNKSTGNGVKITTSSGPKDAASTMQYSQFCSGCHDDYLASRSGDNGNGNGGGRYSNKDKASNNTNHDFLFTHSTNSSQAGRSCYACHYAHGTDVTLMKDTVGRTIAQLQNPVGVNGGEGFTEQQAIDYMKDVRASEPGGSSALKKYTNMAVCFSCHYTSHKIDTSPVDPKYLNGKGDFIGKDGIFGK